MKRASFVLAGRSSCERECDAAQLTLTPASGLLSCDNEAEQDRLYEALQDSGQVYMEMAEYGFSGRFGWVGVRLRGYLATEPGLSPEVPGIVSYPARRFPNPQPSARESKWTTY